MRAISQVKGALCTSLFYLKCILFWIIAGITPRDPKKIIFGAWWGRQFGDNAKYFMKFLLEQNQGFRCYWVGEEYLRDIVATECPKAKFIRKGSTALIWHLLTARWAFFCLGMKSDISTFPTFGKVRLLSMWHGTRIKGVGNMELQHDIPMGKNLRDRIRRLCRSIVDKSVVTECDASFSSSLMVEHQPLYLPWQFSKARSINAGTAKIDFLIQNANNTALIEKLRGKYGKLLGLPTNKKWYLYMPTWRKQLDLKYSFSTSILREKFEALLEKQDAIVIEKQHPQVIYALNISEFHTGNIHMVSNEQMPLIDVQELLLCSQRLLSDYSSCVCDFECMSRPVIHFVYDYEYYGKDDCGFEYDFKEIAAGPLVKTEEELLSTLAMTDEQLLSMKGPNWRDPIDGENGTACETFAKHVGLI